MVLGLVVQEKFKPPFSTKCKMNDKRQVGQRSAATNKAPKGIHGIKHKYKVKHKKDPMGTKTSKTKKK